MSNLRGCARRIFGEVDVFQFDATHELYAHMNINYVRLDELPPFDRWGEAVEPLARGDFFTTTGEVLLPEVDFSASTEDRLDVWMEVDWTFPLRFAEIVWGDEAGATHREVTPVVADAGFRRRRLRTRRRRPRLDLGPGRGLGRGRQRRVRQSGVAGVSSPGRPSGRAVHCR